MRRRIFILTGCVVKSVEGLDIWIYAPVARGGSCRVECMTLFLSLQLSILLTITDSDKQRFVDYELFRESPKITYASRNAPYYERRT